PAPVAQAPATPAAPSLPLPLKRLVAPVSAGWRVKGSRTTITKLLVKNVPAGAKVEVRCKAKSKKRQKKDCPFSKKAAKKRKGADIDALAAFAKKKRTLGAGAVLDIWVTAPGLVGEV